MTSVDDRPVPATRPTGRPQFVDTQSLVFWLFVVVVGYSAVHLYRYITDNPLLSPEVAWLALVQWSIYAVVFLVIVYHHQLFVRRPASLTVAALAWGGFAAVWFSIQADQALEEIFTFAISPEWNARWGLPTSAAINEEVLKTLGIIALVLLPLARVRTTLDGWYYGMMVGLGFQVVEDYLYTVGQANTPDDALKFLVLRGFVAGLWAHAVYAGLVGFGIGYLVSRRDKPMGVRIGVAVGLFAFAGWMHWLWDAPLLKDFAESSSGGFFAVILIKGAPALIILLAVLRWGRQHERRVWSAFVDAHVDPVLVPAADRTALLDRHGRRAARKQARDVGGRRAAHIQKHLQYAQLRYVQSVSEEGADSARAQALAADIRELQALSSDTTPPTATAAPVGTTLG